MKMLRTMILGVVAALAAGGAAQAGSITLTGPTTKAGTYSPSDLATIGAANPSLVVTSGGLTGVSLWGLLGGAAASSPTSPVYGSITTSTPPGHNAKNAILHYYVVGTGTDGSQSVVSGGQIDPSFGATGTQVFVAYQNAGGPQLTTPQFVVPGGPAGSTITSLASLQLLAFPAMLTGAGGESTTVTLSGNVTSPAAYTLTMLENNFTPVQQTVSGDTYTGIPLLTFINTTSANINTQIVVGQGTDGYQVVYSLSELANLNNIIAYAATGTDFPADGVARTILPADNLHGRFISNLQSLAVLNWTVGQMTTVTHDFNTDGLSDIAWRDGSGNTAIWLMDAAQVLQANGIGAIPLAWSLVGQRDFNGDGNADFLWRDSSGNTAIWFLSGGQIASAQGLGNIPNTWTVVATADFNGDGYGDILWQDGSGNLAMWLMNGVQVLSSAGLGNVPSAWAIAGTGDFNGDGKADLLWHDAAGDTAIWFMNGTQISSTASVGTISTDWSIIGVGDFNGDRQTDIVWRDSAGDVSVWLMNGAQPSSTAGIGNVPTTWSLALTGDYNGDGLSDLLWRDGSGDTALWFMSGTQLLSAAGLGNIPTSWTLQSVNAD
jgi:FG-GAP-like repeat